jgi:ubiquinone/menaquinone biosynthesis C-methylase UbiE
MAASATVAKVAGVYAGEHVVLRLLRAMGWGPVLLNLGYFRWRGPLLFVNLVPDPMLLATAQMRLVRAAGALLGARPGERILDVACGRGQSSHYLATTAAGAEVVGMDLLPENIAVARSLFGEIPGLSFQAGDAGSLRFPPGSFDRVLCLEAAFHFPDRRRFLAEAARVLRPGGRLVVVDFMWRARERAAVLADERTRLVQEVWGWSDFSALEEYLEAAAAAGLRHVTTHDWTSRVTAPLTRLSEIVVGLGQRRWGRRLLHGTNERTRGFGRGDWQTLGRAVDAHRFVHRHSLYGVLVLEREGTP